MGTGGFAKMMWRNPGGIWGRAVAQRSPFVIHDCCGQEKSWLRQEDTAEKLNHGLEHGVISAGCAEDLESRESRANKVETKGNS